MSELMITPVDRLFEAHMAVAERDTSIAFYRDRLGVELANLIPARLAAFLWIGSRGSTMMRLWRGRGPQKTTTHVAFGAALDDVIAAPRALQLAGITARDVHGDPTDEPVALPWMPAVSICLRHPDGRLGVHRHACRGLAS